MIAISDATRDDFHQHFGVPLARMRTVYPGLSKSFGSASRPASARPYLLSPYNLSASKNLRSLILAWPAIADRHHDVELILFGRGQVSPESEAEFEQLLQGLSHAHRIRRVGHVPDEELSALYEGCALFVFPTTVEGFGYPLLEAMAHGACCITRDRSAMKELGGTPWFSWKHSGPASRARRSICSRTLHAVPVSGSVRRAGPPSSRWRRWFATHSTATLPPPGRTVEAVSGLAPCGNRPTLCCSAQPPHPRARIVEIRVAFEAVGPLSSAKGRSDGLDGQGQGDWSIQFLFGWHSLDVGGGVVSNGQRPAEQVRRQWEDLKQPEQRGKTVLDINTWDGFFAFEAEKHGASSVCALDFYMWAMDLQEHRRHWKECQERTSSQSPIMRCHISNRRSFQASGASTLHITCAAATSSLSSQTS